MVVYIYVWKWLEMRKLPLSTFISLFIWNPVISVIKMTCQKHCRLVYQKDTLSFSVNLIFLSHTIWLHEVAARGLLSSHALGLTGTCWSLLGWYTLRQTLVWSATCWRTWWRCVEEFSIHSEACSYGTTCCSARATCCQILLSKRMSQKARYICAYNSVRVLVKWQLR